MVRRICPVCDQVMRSAHYCGNCRSWVKNPWVRDVTYYLNERHPRSEADCDFHGNWSGTEKAHGAGNSGRGVAEMMGNRTASAQPGQPRRDGQVSFGRVSLGGRTVPNQPRQSSQAQTGSADQGRTSWPNVSLPGGGGQRKQDGRGRSKGLNLALIVILAVYIAFKLVWAGARVGGSFLDFGWRDSGNWSYETAIANPVDYQVMDEEAVIASGEPCSARDHFAVQGELLLEPLEGILESRGFDVEEIYTYTSNTLEDDGETWFETVTTIELGGDGYQYVEINYDTATGELHEVYVSMADGEAAAAVMTAALSCMADAGAVSLDAEDTAALQEELDHAVEAEGYQYMVYGNAAVQVYGHSDGYGIELFPAWE